MSPLRGLMGVAGLMTAGQLITRAEKCSGIERNDLVPAAQGSTPVPVAGPAGVEDEDPVDVMARIAPLIATVIR